MKKAILCLLLCLLLLPTAVFADETPAPAQAEGDRHGSFFGREVMQKPPFGKDGTSMNAIPNPNAVFPNEYGPPAF